MLAQDRPKRDFTPGQQVKKPKVKKPITPLTVLTPKNLATNAPPQADPLNGKAGWDLNKPVQQVTQNKPRNPPKNNQPTNNGQVSGQQAQGAAPKNNQPKAKAPQGNNPNVPVNASPAQQATVNTQNPGTQNQNQGGQKKGGNQPAQPNNKQQQRGNPNKPAGGQQAAVSPNPAAAQQANTQGRQGNQTTQQAVTQQNQATQNQPAGQNQPNQNQPGKGAKKRKNKKNPETQIRYRVNVVDTKNNLPLHVIELNQGQYDKFVLPLVTKH